MRLDGYSETAPELFQQVVDRIANDVLPIVRQSGLAGGRPRMWQRGNGGGGVREGGATDRAALGPAPPPAARDSRPPCARTTARRLPPFGRPRRVRDQVPILHPEPGCGRHGGGRAHRQVGAGPHHGGRLLRSPPRRRAARGGLWGCVVARCPGAEAPRRPQSAPRARLQRQGRAALPWRAAPASAPRPRPAPAPTPTPRPTPTPPPTPPHSTPPHPQGLPCLLHPRGAARPLPHRPRDRRRHLRARAHPPLPLRL
jgi:hypothetical protein